ncbi:MAG: hypothetical protein RR258_04110, partial [Alistipes sp.]
RGGFRPFDKTKGQRKKFSSYKTLHDPRACREVARSTSTVTLRPLDKLEDRVFSTVPLRPLDKLEDRVELHAVPLRPLDKLEDRVELHAVPLRPLDKLEDREMFPKAFATGVN